MKIFDWFSPKKKEIRQSQVFEKLSPEQVKATETPALKQPANNTETSEGSTHGLPQDQVDALAKPVLDYLWKFQVKVLELSADFAPPSDLFVFGVRNNAHEPGEHIAESVRRLDEGLRLKGKLVGELEDVSQSVRSLRESVWGISGAGEHFGLFQKLGAQVQGMQKDLERYSPGYRFSMTMQR
jgi:hypothetical protein